MTSLIPVTGLPGGQSDNRSRLGDQGPGEGKNLFNPQAGLQDQSEQFAVAQGGCAVGFEPSGRFFSTRRSEVAAGIVCPDSVVSWVHAQELYSLTRGGRRAPLDLGPPTARIWDALGERFTFGLGCSTALDRPTLHRLVNPVVAALHLALRRTLR